MDLSQCRAFHIFYGFQLSGQLLSHLARDWLLTVLGKLLYSCRVVTQVNLCSNKQERCTLAVMSYLWNPLNTQTLNIQYCGQYNNYDSSSGNYVILLSHTQWEGKRHTDQWSAWILKVNSHMTHSQYECQSYR